MFRRQPGSLPKDPIFQDALNETGHFIADDGTIRQISKPKEFFVFRATDNERFNEVRKEAVNGAIRKELKKRMIKEGMQVWYLPQLRTRKPKEAHVPILTTPPEILRRCKRVIVVVNEDSQDLGVFAWRDVGGEPGLDGGSVLGIVKELNRRFTNPVNGSWPVGQESSSDSDDTLTAEVPSGCNEATQVAKDLKKIHYPDAPGLIVLNPGQLRYSLKENRAMNTITWHDRPRKSALHPMSPVDEDWNTVPGHRNALQHIKWVFDRIATDSNWVSPKAEIYVVALNSGARHMLQLLDEEWPKYSRLITAMAITQSYGVAENIDNPELRSFLRRRCRAWMGSDAPLNAPIALPEGSNPSTPQPSYTIPEPSNGMDETVYYPTFSTGKWLFAEQIFPAMHTHVLDWFEEVARDAFGYKNPEFELYVAPPEPETVELAEPVEDESEAVLPHDSHQGPGTDAASSTFLADGVGVLGAFPASDDAFDYASADEAEPALGSWGKPESPEKVMIAGTLVPKGMAEMAGLGGLVTERASTRTPEMDLEVQVEDKDGKKDDEEGAQDRKDSQAV